MSDIQLGSREKYWEELSVDEKLDKIAYAVDVLSDRYTDFDRSIALMNQHRHGPDGTLLIPLTHNEPTLPWFLTHLLNRKPKGGA